MNDFVYIFCIYVVKKQTVLFLNYAIFTCCINGLAQFFMQNQSKHSIFQSIKKR
ncbi:hypothetical protein CKO_04881 [Citrobacter koseri ATCC BAA-895]|uniref:Uncharacterized protein n=1 Tax=Citrobacter koseri (strain ATCC BAA-895 / CDC 4225-83 / SGSC4696) TaxID=290338 RepID=A8AR12_CITK8|nr:hypothetical protein CKO_04881 [Citrobacter koseri ATCC BAA-895]